MLRELSISTVLIAVVGLGPTAANLDVRVTDGTGRPVTIASPAKRIVSLAPHTTELLYTAGAGARIVATVEYSDYPAAARAIPHIGNASGVDLERIIALKPDLIVAWATGNPRATIERLVGLGFPVYLAEPHRLEDVANDLENLGRLAGTDQTAHAVATQFTARYRALAERYAGRAKLRVFYQVLDPLLMTVNASHLISEILQLCGGENIFAPLPVIAPSVSEEAVMQADPDAIVAGGIEPLWSEWQARWRLRKDMVAVKRGALYFIPAERLHRHSVRVLEGAEQLCADLDDARRRRQ